MKNLAHENWLNNIPSGHRIGINIHGFQPYPSARNDHCVLNKLKN